MEPGSSAIISSAYYHIQKMLPCNSEQVSILVLKASNADVDVIMATAHEATPARLTITRMEGELRVAKQTWLKPRYIGKFKAVSK